MAGRYCNYQKDTNLLQLPISTLYFRSFGSKVQKARFCAKNYDQNLHFLFTYFFRQKNCFKIESLHLGQFSRPYFSIELQFFSLLIFAGHASAISREPVLHFLTWLVGARKEFWVIQSYCERRTLPIPISKIFL